MYLRLDSPHVSPGNKGAAWSMNKTLGVIYTEPTSSHLPKRLAYLSSSLLCPTDPVSYTHLTLPTNSLV